MQAVDPIRDKKKIGAMKSYLRARSPRDLALFVLGINSGLRISDILSLKVEDVVDGKGKLRERIVVQERKTKKPKSFPLADSAKRPIRAWLKRAGLRPDQPLFLSRKGGNKPISRIQAYRILNDAAKGVGIESKVGTHTLRKTFGYHAYNAGYDLPMIQKLLNHSSPEITLRYIGITQDQMDDVYHSLNL